MARATMREINPPDPPAPLNEASRAEIAALARRQARAGGVLLRAVNLVGSSVEDGMRFLPAPVRRQLDRAAAAALLRAYEAAGRTRGGAGWRGRLAGLVVGDRAHRALAALSGAVGGVGGLPTVAAELPLATTLIFRAVQGVAEAHGEDPATPETRAECLRVFAAGGEEPGERGVDASFVGARLSLSGAAINRLVARIAPRFGAVIGQKLAAGAVPVLGAAAGAGTNWAFMGYYVEMAHVHFGLRRLSRIHGDAALDEFHRALAAEAGPMVPVRRA